MNRRTTTLAIIAAGCALTLSSNVGVARGGPPAGVGGGRPASIPAAPPQTNRPETLPQPANPQRQEPNSAASEPNQPSGTTRMGDTDTSTRPVVGKVVSFNGTTLTLALPTGQTKTFTVNGHAFGQLKPGIAVAVRAKDGQTADTIVSADREMQGTVSAVTRWSVTMTLPNGNTVMVMVPAQAAAHIPLKPGSNATIISHDGGFSADRILLAKNNGSLTAAQHRHVATRTKHANTNGTTHADVNSSKNPNGVNGTRKHGKQLRPSPSPVPSATPSPAPTATP